MLCMLVRFHASSLWVLVKQFGEDLERERARKSSHLNRSSIRLSGKHSYSVSIAMVTRGPEQGMLGVAGKPLWCLVSRVLTKHIRLRRNSDFSPEETSP